MILCEVCGKSIMAKWVFELKNGTEVCFDCFNKDKHEIKGMTKIYSESK
jgi:hypothetical protein